MATRPLGAAAFAAAQPQADGIPDPPVPASPASSRPCSPPAAARGVPPLKERFHHYRSFFPLMR